MSRIIIHNRITLITKEQFAMCMVMKANSMRYKEIAKHFGVTYYYMCRVFWTAKKFGFAAFEGKIIEEVL